MKHSATSFAFGEALRPRAFALVLGAIVLAAACVGSEPVNFERDGAAPSGAGGGGAGSGAVSSGAGGSGAASSGAGGSGAAPAGAAGATAGSHGTAGATSTGGSGAAGSSGRGGSVGSGAGGTSSGTAGSGGKTDGGAAGSTGAMDAAAEVKVYTYTTGIENLLIQNCGGCHFAAPGVSIQGGFSFSYANVTGVTGGHPSCVGLDASKRRVVPGKPDNSLLWIKAFMDSPPANCGGHMPFQGSRLSDTTLGYIKAWILAGAPQ